MASVEGVGLVAWPSVEGAGEVAWPSAEAEPPDWAGTGCGVGDTGWAAMGESAVMSQRLGQGYDEKRGVGPGRACP
ncbi:hypothetical protein Aph02nite_04300 [Actinoplanes philippinensis]|nr:hypothetical protein Aph02nite_04300 [Actinoplanes philippinensis]